MTGSFYTYSVIKAVSSSNAVISVQKSDLISVDAQSSSNIQVSITKSSNLGLASCSYSSLNKVYAASATNAQITMDLTTHSDFSSRIYIECTSGTCTN